MLKKIVLGTLFIGLIGILVTGTVIRTMDRTGRVAEARGPGYGRDNEAGERAGGEPGQGRGWGNSEADAYAAGGSGRGFVVSAQPNGRGGYGWGGNSSGYGGRGRENAPGDQTGTGAAHVEEWLTLQGTVVSVDADTLVVQTESGEQVTMENRAWWFAQEQGFSAQVGDPSTGSELCFEVGQIDDATNGQTVLIRDENGRPLWAGRGRRGG